MFADWLSQAYRFNVEDRLWARPGDDNGWRYNDGDEVEQRVAHIINSAFDRSVQSLELRDAITDWPSRYHLSARRSNLLRPLRNRLKGSVLEIGAGCGAITRYLGELGCDVVAVEGSGRRAAIAASRCIDLSNVAVVTDDFGRLPPGATFDIVTLIGVAEYARVYAKDATQDPVDRLLERAAQFLKPDGILILAIENQLGLKYFSGCREDHLGRAMFGVEDRYTSDSPVTFGRLELAGRLKRAGLPSLQWWFPQPDYKLPICSLSDRLEDADVGVDLSSLLCESVRAEPQPADAPTFSLEQAWRPVYRNGLWANLANSFLVLGSRNALPRDNILAEYYGHERLPVYSKLVRFEWADPKVIVHREPTSRAAPASSLPISIQFHDEPLFSGKNWDAELLRLLNEEGWSAEQWTNWTRRWFDALLERANLPLTPVPAPAQPLPGHLLDAIPRNMLVREGGAVEFFDQEWRSESSVELGYLVYRAINVSLSSINAAARPAPGTSMNVSQLMHCFTRSLGWDVSTEDFKRYFEMEADFQRMVSAWPAPDIGALHRQLPAKARIEKIQELSVALSAAEQQNVETRSLLTSARNEVASARNEVASTRSEIDRLLRKVATLEQQAARQQTAIAGLQDTLDHAEAAVAYVGGRCSERRATTRMNPFPRGVRRLWKKRPNVPKSLYSLVRDSAFFDADFYLKSNPDVKRAGLDPVLHYILNGSAEGRPPSPILSETEYRRQFPDASAAGMSAVQHYETHGRKEGRRLLSTLRLAE